jgi:hypothetical protein
MPPIEKSKAKNQHYVPKFYLKRFSVEGNQKEIIVYAFDSKKFIPRASIKHQASKSYFYGKDEVIEKKLASKEGKWAAALRQIEVESIPPNSSVLYYELLQFTITTDLRNPVRKLLNDRIIERTAINQRDNVLRDPAINPLLKAVTATYVESWILEEKRVSIQKMLDKVQSMERIASDLKLVLVRNETEIPFMTSDYPVIHYNQLYESKSGAKNNSTGYSSLGCQLFFPISDTTLLIFYDSLIYSLSTKDKKPLATKTDVDFLNRLQALNSATTIFGNERLTEKYLRSILSDSVFKIPKLRYTFPRNKIGLELSFLKLSPKGSKVLIKPNTIPQRKKASEISKSLRFKKGIKKRK